MVPTATPSHEVEVVVLFGFDDRGDCRLAGIADRPGRKPRVPVGIVGIIGVVEHRAGDAPVEVLAGRGSLRHGDTPILDRWIRLKSAPRQEPLGIEPIPKHPGDPCSLRRNRGFLLHDRRERDQVVRRPAVEHRQLLGVLFLELFVASGPVGKHSLHDPPRLRGVVEFVRVREEVSFGVIRFDAVAREERAVFRGFEEAVGRADSVLFEAGRDLESGEALGDQDANLNLP